MMESILSLFEDADPFKTWWPTIIAVGFGIMITIRTLMGGQRCPNENQIRDQIVIVTGGNIGIGFEIAKALASRGGRIILACRDMSAGERAASIIRRELGVRYKSISVGDGHDSDDSGFFVEARYLELCSFESVTHFARNIMAEFERIDILVNNAGIIFHPAYATTLDGFEIHLQVNYLAHFLLTQLLLPHLRKSVQGRIINVSAHAHAAAKIDFDDPLNVGTWAVKFHVRDAFAHSKLAVILATRWLAKELNGSTVTVNCCTPGLVRGTGHLRNSPLMRALCVKMMTYPWMWLFMKNPFEGAQCAIRMATDPQLKTVTGEYFNDCEVAETSEIAKDMKLAKKLFEESMRLVEKVLSAEEEKQLTIRDADSN